MPLKVDKTGFPTVVKEDYRGVYAKFLEAEPVLSLSEELRPLAFVSYIQKLDRSVRYQFEHELDYKVQINLLRLFIRRNGLFHGLSCVHNSGKFSVDQNTFLNALMNPAYVGILRFEDGQRYTVNRHIEELKTTVFGGRLPHNFATVRNIKTVLNSKSPWVRLQTNPLLEIALYREGQRSGILVRYGLHMNSVLFYGAAESNVRSITSKLKRQIMSRRIYE